MHHFNEFPKLASLVVAWALVFSGIPLLAEQNTATVEVSTRTELVTAVASAKPGTIIAIAPGEYRGGLWFSHLQGTKAKPIIIKARDPRQPPRIVGGASGLHLRQPMFVEIHDLVLTGATGNGVNIDDGGDPNRPAGHLVLRGLQVQDVGPKGNHDGIKLSGVDHFIIDHCTVERWGENGSAIDMVGCHHGKITKCEFQYRSNIPGNGVQTKGGSSDIRIERCRFENAGGRAINIGGSTGREYFRPRNANYEAKNISVEDCTFSGSMSPIVFVGVDGATVRFNTFYRPTRWVMRILQESRGPQFLSCRNGVFSNNVIAWRAAEVRTVVNVGSGTSPETFRFAGNHWYCLDKPARGARLGLPTAETDGTHGSNPLFRNPGQGDFSLREDSPVKNAGVRPEKMHD